MEMMKAQVTYLMVPLMVLISTAAWKYRYRTATGISEIGDTAATTNYWQMLDNGAAYWSMTAHLILTITQLLSMLGIMAEINVMAWMYLGLADMAVSLIYAGAYLYVYNTYYSLE